MAQQLFEGQHVRPAAEFDGQASHVHLGALLNVLERSEAALLFGQVFELAFARAIEPAAVDERDDLVQLPGVEERAVPAADVHDHA